MSELERMFEEGMDTPDEKLEIESLKKISSKHQDYSTKLIIENGKLKEKLTAAEAKIMEFTVKIKILERDLDMEISKQTCMKKSDL